VGLASRLASLQASCPHSAPPPPPQPPSSALALVAEGAAQSSLPCQNVRTCIAGRPHLKRFGKPDFRHFFVEFLRSVRLLRVTVHVVPSSSILVTLMIEALSSSETSVLTRATRHNIPEDGILHSHSRENLKSYIALTGWTL
jgi:hypothetical protein